MSSQSQRSVNIKSVTLAVHASRTLLAPGVALTIGLTTLLQPSFANAQSGAAAGAHPASATDVEGSKSFLARQTTRLSGILGIFTPQTAPATDQSDRLPMDDASRPVVSVQIESGPVARTDETRIEVAADDLRSLNSHDLVFEETARALRQGGNSRSLAQRLRGILPFGRSSARSEGVEIPVVPENPELLRTLQGMEPGMIKKFFEIQQGALSKIAMVSRRANIPANEMVSLMSHANTFLFSSAKQIVAGSAWSSGFDVQVYGGPAAGRLGNTIIMGLIQRTVGDNMVTRTVARLLERGNSFFFQGSVGFNVIHTTDVNGRKRSFLQLNTIGDRTRSVLTTTGIAGYDVRLVLTTYDQGAIDPVTGRTRASQTKTTTLGMVGAMTSGGGVNSIAISVPIPIVGGASLIPFVGSLAIYESDGGRRALLTVPLSAIQENSVVRGIGATYRFTAGLLGGSSRGRRCEGLFTPVN